MLGVLGRGGVQNTVGADGYDTAGHTTVSVVAVHACPHQLRYDPVFIRQAKINALSTVLIEDFPG